MIEIKDQEEKDLERELARLESERRKRALRDKISREMTRIYS